MTLPNIDPGRRSDLYLAVQYICDTFGVDYNEDTAEHMLVFLEALRIYGERTKQYGPLWRKVGALENFYDAARKARRVKTVWQGRMIAAEKGMAAPTYSDDDALDVINYIIFGIRNVRANRIYEESDG